MNIDVFMNQFNKILPMAISNTHHSGNVFIALETDTISVLGCTVIDIPESQSSQFIPDGCLRDICVILNPNVITNHAFNCRLLLPFVIANTLVHELKHVQQFQDNPDLVRSDFGIEADIATKGKLTFADIRLHDRLASEKDAKSTASHFVRHNFVSLLSIGFDSLKIKGRN